MVQHCRQMLLILATSKLSISDKSQHSEHWKSKICE